MIVARLHHAADIILHLNEPNRLPDIAEWFTPHKYAGVWWEMHLDTKSWRTGANHGATTANVKKHIDFAAANGIRGVLVEGWNPGWDGDWFATGHDFDFTRPVPGLDLEGVVAYGRERGVRLVGHHETAGNLRVYEPQLDAALDLYARLGIDSVKTGYVADAGGIRTPDNRFEWHDGQAMTRHHMQVVEAAAKRGIAVNPHEPVKDTGLRRTWPNWVSREGARGMEYNAWGNPKNPPSHEPTLVFTRMLAGPMDYTPGILSLVGRGDSPIPSTLARQLALYVALYSPIQMVPDLPENYARFPDAFAFIRRVPADWKDSRMLAGRVGQYAVVARADRASDDWYLGAITDEEGRTLEVPLTFLSPGRRYEATIWRDAEGADYRTETRFGHAIETREVTPGEPLRLVLAPGGGQAIHFRALAN
jgi:alpha-glucosidase